MAELMAEEVEYEKSALFAIDISVIADAVRAERKSSRHDRRVAARAVRMTAIHARVHRLPPERLVRAPRLWCASSRWMTQRRRSV
jgi:hypothetical protein